LNKHAQALQGIWVPLVTPFRDGAVDLDGLQAITEELIEAGVHGLVVCGTTGEAAQLDEAEQMSALALVLDCARALCPVVFGIGGSDTRAAVRKVSHFDGMDIAGYLVSPPAYVRPSQDGIVRHFEAIAAQTDKPVVLYNVPARTGVALQFDTMRLLAARPQFAAVKEAAGSIAQLTDLIEQTPLSVLCGDDTLLFASLCAGGHGAISAAAHVRPDLYIELFDLVRAQRLDQARALFRRLLPMIRLLFSEPNPAPLKAVLQMQGLIREELRLPMTPVSSSCRQQLAAALESLMALPVYRSPTLFSAPSHLVPA
jgi:4-hydroxy-tetrahydrodipicolinate synthase